MSPPSKHEKDFAAYLKSLIDDERRDALAALRRALGRRPGEVFDPCPYVDPWLGSEPTRRDEDAHYLVAALFGLHQGAWQPEGDQRDPTNLGASFARLRAEVESASVERRFVALLNCHRDDLPDHLRHAISLLKSKEIPIDWAQLLHDVRGWDRVGRDVQREWARAFWGRADGEQVPAGVEGQARDKVNAD